MFKKKSCIKKIKNIYLGYCSFAEKSPMWLNCQNDILVSLVFKKITLWIKITWHVPIKNQGF